MARLVTPPAAEPESVQQVYRGEKLDAERKMQEFKGLKAEVEPEEPEEKAAKGSLSNV